MSHNKQQPSRLTFKMHLRGKDDDHQQDEHRLQQAREKAQEYRNPSPVIDQAGDEVAELDEFSNVVSKRIEEAMRRGEFENLRGQGKPMPIDNEPFVPEERQLVNRILKNNDLTPDWIADRKELFRGLEAWRTELQRIASEAQNAWLTATTDERRAQVQQKWDVWVGRWEGEIAELNKRIGLFNLKQPIRHLEVYKLLLDEELQKAGMQRTLTL